MMIRNLKHSGDYNKAILTNNELLRIQAANNQVISLARKNAALGVPTEMPHHLTLSKTEQLQDRHSQLIAARDKLVEMGFNSGEAVEITTALGDGDIIIMNQTFPGMRKLFESVYSVKQATPKLFLNWFEKYSEELAASKGLSFGNVGKFDALTDNVEDIITIYPTRESIIALAQSWRHYISKSTPDPDQLEIQIYDDLRGIVPHIPSQSEWNTLKSNSVENNILD